MVAVLKGPPSFPIEIESAGRIDSVKGGIRATFENVPDAPVTEIVASFPGGSKGLLENSTNLCTHKYFATAKYVGQNGKTFESENQLVPPCKIKKPSKKPKG
jgi:hypothetical protein